MKPHRYTIEVDCGLPENEEFVAWLNRIGHIAKVGNTTHTFIDGVDVSSSEHLTMIYIQLWQLYCKTGRGEE